MYRVSSKSKYYANEYVFNASLFSRLPEFIGMKNVAIMKDLGVSRSTYVRWKEKASIPMNLLIKLCNEYNMRVSWFITPANTSFNVPDDYERKDASWHFDFNSHAMLSNFGDEGISWREASRLTGHSRKSLMSWCDDTATVGQVLYMLNTFIIPITSVISDTTLKDIDCTTSCMKKTILQQQIHIERLIEALRNKKSSYDDYDITTLVAENTEIINDNNENELV